MILDYILPHRCLHCNLIIDSKEILCEDCFFQIPFTHHQFGRNNLLFDRCISHFPVENSFALMTFGANNLGQIIVHQLKYSDKENFGKHIADWTIDKLHFEKKPDLLVTIPLHPKKEKKRGYNQLHLFANIISKHFAIPLDNQLLKRKFYNKAQAKKDKSHRAEILNLFEITKEIKNKHILLIDDVLTTGNTISSAAWELIKNGNNKVSVFVMALD